MNDIAYNLISITGNKAELERFEKTAYKNDNEVFCLKCLLPIPDYRSKEEKPYVDKYAFVKMVHGGRQKGTFSILVEKSEHHLKYFFNTIKKSMVIEYLAVKYPKLNFSLVFFELQTSVCGIEEYKDGKSFNSLCLDLDKFDFEIPSQVGTYSYIEDLGMRLHTLLDVNPEIGDDLVNSPSLKIKFFDYIKRDDFLKNHQDYYEKLILKELELGSCNLYYACFACKFPLVTNNTTYLNKYIEENFLSPTKREFFRNKVSSFIDIKNENRSWWNNLSVRWKNEFVRNLKNNLKSLEDKTPEHVLDFIESTDKGLEQLLGLKQLHVKADLIADLSPVFYLKNLNDFRIIEPEYFNADFLCIYPIPLRKKVKSLNLDGMSLCHLGILEDFVGLKHLSCRKSDLESLYGVENLWQLETLNVGEENHFSSLKPLSKLRLISLDISSSNVTDIRHLKEMKSLEVLNLLNTCINDLSPLLEFSKLKHLVLPDETVLSETNNQITKFEKENKLQQELKNYINQKSSPTQNNQVKVKLNPEFDYNKKWFLVPDIHDVFEIENDYEIIEKAVLVDRYNFKIQNEKRKDSRIYITDNIGVFEYISNTPIYPATVERDSWLKPITEHLWKAEKVKLGKPFRMQYFIFEKVPNPFPGNIKIYKFTLNKEFIFPKIIKGTLKLDDCILSEYVRLPEKIEGDFILNNCEIQDIEWPRDSKEITFKYCKLNKKLVIPDNGIKQIKFRATVLSDKWIFGKTFNGNISIDNCSILEGFILPEVINGTLSIKYTELKATLKLPKATNYEITLKHEDDIKKIEATPEVINIIERV